MKLLLADTDPARAAWLERELAGGEQSGQREIVRIAPGENLADAYAAHAPDVLIVDMQRPDRDALESLRPIAARMAGPVVMFIDDDDDSFMEEAIAAGVSSYNVVGRALPEVRPIVRAAVALFRRYRNLQDELARAETDLRRRALIDRAKALLIRTRKMSEPEAYRWLQRQAMRRSRPLAAVAAELLAPEDDAEDDGA